MGDDKGNEFNRWYQGLAKQLGLNPNPHHPLHFFDYKAAWKDGAKPDKEGHLPSKYKHDWHPNRFIQSGPDGRNLPRGHYWDTKSEDKIVTDEFKKKFDRLRIDLEYRVDKGLF